MGPILVCIAMSASDPCVFHEPWYGRGHVAYSSSMPFVDVEREAANECRVVHGDDECVVICHESRVEVPNVD